MKRIFFDTRDGTVLFEYVNISGTNRSKEHDRTVFPVIKNLNDTDFDFIDITDDQYAQDFAECNGYRVNAETKTLEFSYPDPNEPGVEQPYQAPLSEKVAQLEVAQAETNATLLEFIESSLLA